MTSTNGSTNGKYVFPSWVHNRDMPFEKFAELVSNVITSRSQLLQSFTDPRRNINDECGYPKTEFTPENYQDLYDREAIAARVVEIYPEESWKVSPSVYEEEDAETVTEFETAWDELGKSLRSEENWHEEEEGSLLWDYLRRVDVLSGIGHYGILLLGLDDGADLTQPVRSSKKLLYLRAFPESLAQITQLDNDRTSPRYGMPLEYSVTFNDPQQISQGGVLGATTATQSVHWSRVIHVADNLSSSEVYGIPRMRQVLRKLLDIEKISAASGEGYWRGAFPGLSFETHPNTDVDVSINIGSIRDQAENYMNGLQRYLAMTGMTAKTLTPNIADPTMFIKSKIEEICIKLNVPVRIFVGSERGELASSQDEKDWDDTIRGRHHRYLTPRLIVPFANRLIALGVLPKPKSFKVFWPDVAKISDQEKANVAQVKTAALAAYVSGQVETIMPPADYLTRIMGMEEEEVDAILESAAQEVEATLERRETFGIQPPPQPEEPPPGEEPIDGEQTDEEVPQEDEEPATNKAFRTRTIVRHYREKGGAIRSEITKEE